MNDIENKIEEICNTICKYRIDKTDAVNFNQLTHLLELMQQLKGLLNLSNFEKNRKTIPEYRPLDHQIGGNHYKQMGIEPLEYCAEIFNIDEFVGGCKMNIIKYLTRNKGQDDLLKACHYAEILKSYLSGDCSTDKPCDVE